VQAEAAADAEVVALMVARELVAAVLVAAVLVAAARAAAKEAVVWAAGPDWLRA
jgi:hypothetical protein